MSVICRTFVQNAWRSDLCSNCFKSLEDHTDGTARRNNVCEKLSMPRYVPQAASLYQSRGISTSLKWRLNESLYDKVSRRDFASQTPKTAKVSQEPEPPVPSSRGILIKTDTTSSEKKYKSRPSVDFASEEALVIGYGGNDYDSDTSPWEMGSDDGSIDFDLLDDTDEDRNITRLTKNNTEFNSFNKNLLLGENAPNQITKDEEKLNTINNNVNNQVKTSDKSISILTYNDIQSTKAEKKLNQYFFPSSTEIKSYLNGHGNSLILEDAVLKNNNEKSQITTNAKVQNSKREAEKKDNMNSKVVLNDEFTPLNTRTYSFVSELNKSSVSFEQSSDSDYSTCRHTPGDSTDSESFHDAEEARPLPKLSFLHGTYTVSSPQINELDIDKKYDAGSSTSGDVSNFSDDSDTVEPTDRISYKARNTRAPGVQIVTENKVNQKDLEENVDLNRRNEEATAQNDRRQEEKAIQINKQEEWKTPNKSQKDSSPKTDNKKQLQTKCNPKPKQSCPIARPEDSSIELVDKESLNVSQVLNNKVSSEKNLTHESEKHSLKYVTKESGFSMMVSKSASMPNIQPSSDVIDLKRSPISRNQTTLKKDFKPGSCFLDSKAVKEEPLLNSSASNLRDTLGRGTERRQNSSSTETSDGKSTDSDYLKEQILQDKDFIDSDNSDYEKSPEAINNRQSKLAALALELELARRDSESKANKPPSPPAPIPPPEVKVRFSKTNTQINSASSPENFPTIKKPSAISCCSRLSSLPDVLQETPAKQKKSKFSLKKLLKRNKDSGTFSPSSNKEVNPKAWKKQTFDRNRLSLEIVHPMDLTSDVPTSADTTPTEEHRQIVSTHPGKFMFKGVSNRARSLSALPQLSSEEQSGCALLDCKKMDTVPMRKAGTVAERKKNRPALVRTPSCSALPNRSSSAGNSPSHYSSNDRAPPPKPPPPPKCKVMHPPPPPPPPHSHPRATKTNSVSPARPPPPKVPENKSRSHSSGSSTQELREQNHSDKEYANLGDIRSLLTPKKPQRPSAFSASSRGDSEIGPKKSEDIYETLPATVEEEEDHYTYLDEAEVKASQLDPSKKAETAQKIKSSPETVQCGRPWLDLQTSYAAIAAANYESLAELITTSLNESAEYFKKVELSLKWRDFVLDSKEHYTIIKEKAVYNAVYKNESQDTVTLVVAPRKQIAPQNAKSQTRYPVLASFNDHVPKNFISTDNYILQESEMASIYILQQSKVTNVSNFAQASSSELANQHIHLRNYCFVLLQLIHTLKSLQAEGIEEINYDLQILILVVTDDDKPPILVLFPEDKIHLTLSDLSNRKTLCQATLETMLHFLQINEIEDLKTCVVNGELLAEPVAHTFRAIAKVLSEEKASSLSQAKGFLEYMLWGPVDVKISQNESEKTLDTILQRWLDLQRAQMVKSTISHLQNRKKLNEALHVYEEYQLIFLLQASAKSLKNVISKL